MTLFFPLGCQNDSDGTNNRIIGCNSEADELTFYHNKGLAPAAFVGNVTDVRYSYYIFPPNPADPWVDTQGVGPSTRFRLIEALGNWHMQFLSLWIGGPGITPMGLLDAKRQADWLAWELPQEGGGLPGIDPAPPQEDQLDLGPSPNEPAELYYSPVNAIKIAGYLQLGFNAWNHAADALP